MEKFETPYVAITDAIASHAKWRPARTALVCGDQRLTWREFNQAIDRVANGLIKGGLRKGDKVSVLTLNSVEMLEIMMGTVKAGGVIVPLSVMLTAESLSTMINDSDSRFIFAGAPFARVIDSIRRDLLNISSEGFFVVGDETQNWIAWIDYQGWRDESTDTPITGDITAHLFASTSGTDSDWIVKLIDVYPESYPKDPKMGGYQLMIADEILRGRFRHSFAKPDPITPNQVFPLVRHDR